MSGIKTAQTEYPIHQLISKRWSPYIFDKRMVNTDDLHSIFEAARWAASSNNEQPWYYVVGTKDNPEQINKVLSCLVEANQQWAKAAPVLALGIVGNLFKRNNKPNRWAIHDLGQASANLSIEATARGISVHQMAGINPDKAKTEFNIPDNYEAVTALAIGYTSDNNTTSEEYRKRDTTPRTRRPLSEWIYSDTWGQTHPLFKV